MEFGKNLFNGIIPENPIFRLMLGMCPTLAVTTAAVNGLGMGLATTVVLVGSNVVIALLKNVIPEKIRIPAFVVIIASFVTIVGMLLKAYIPSLDKSLGLFIPLIVVNCIILARAESFASKNNVMNSLADGLGMGLGFTLALTIIASIRELFGAGSIFGISLFGAGFEPAIMMILPPGAFLTLGLLLALLNKVTATK
ncbi:electron transport complex subunit RsxE [Alkalibacter mobilis]|uniref:electron transport complex subunit RsxE n=1 Tax=Alkalibacter mobilis TaxID=2787712 RepID=UPI00189CAC99|nr:electron transport complex subunit E [Alkalibacter mobilis]MBF7097857.1 electron transport complex subunit E [Alkalibacter mobilis]